MCDPLRAGFHTGFSVGGGGAGDVVCGLTGMGEYTFLQVTPRDVCDPLREFAYYMWCVCVCVFGRGVCMCVCIYGVEWRA